MTDKERAEMLKEENKLLREQIKLLKQINELQNKAETETGTTKITYPSYPYYYEPCFKPGTYCGTNINLADIKTECETNVNLADIKTEYGTC